MPTPSVRLSEGLYRAVKSSNYGISELSREGIEQALADDFVSVCWTCGDAIHSKSRREWLDRERFRKDIAHDDVTDPEIPVGEFDYRRRVHAMRERFPAEDGPDNELYYYRAGQWLNLPEYMPVEFCSSCSEILDGLRTKDIPVASIPIPYQYRPAVTDEEFKSPDFWSSNPATGYAAEAAAVWYSDYSSFLQYHCNSALTDGLLWWATRNRAKGIVGSDFPPWLEIALRANAHCMMKGVRPQPVWILARDKSENLDDWWPGGGPPPGLEPDPGKNSAFCPSCRTENASELYCEACFYSEESCPNGCGRLAPITVGEWKPGTKVKLGCTDCNYEADPQNFTEDFWNRYESLTKEVRRVVP